MRPAAETGHRVPAARCGRCIGRRSAAGTPRPGSPEEPRKKRSTCHPQWGRGPAPRRPAPTSRHRRRDPANAPLSGSPRRPGPASAPGLPRPGCRGPAAGCDLFRSPTNTASHRPAPAVAAHRPATPSRLGRQRGMGVPRTLSAAWCPPAAHPARAARAQGRPSRQVVQLHDGCRRCQPEYGISTLRDPSSLICSQARRKYSAFRVVLGPESDHSCNQH